MLLSTMTMQVGLQNSTRTPGGELSPPSVKDATRVKSITRRQERDEYPASPLLAHRPQRYSVQLNDQLTTIQQADSYLSRLEKTLLNQRHSSSGGGQRGEERAALAELLANRTHYSAGRVDRQLLPVLQGEAQVTFHSPELAALLSGDEKSVSLTFSVEAGRGRRLAAVSLANTADVLNPTMQIKNALQRTGVMPHYGEGQWTFSTAETGWSQLQRSFTLADAQGEHARRLSLHATSAPADALSDALAAGQRDGLRSMVQNVLNQVGEQRQRLASAQQSVRQRMDVMARFPEAQSAARASAALGQTLAWACHDYSSLIEALNGQANLPALTVQILLG